MVALFFVLSLVAALIAVVFLIILRRKQRALADTLSNCSDQLRVLTSSTIEVGKRLIEVEHDLQKINHSWQQPAMTTPVRSTYHHASALLHKGASVEEVVRTCDISRAEADFLYKIVLSTNR